MTVYNKLVRDKIPEIIERNGGKAQLRLLSDEEYIACLEAKLDEEVGEYHRDKTLEELADILEVVFALAATAGCSMEQLMEIYRRKNDARGGFTKRCFLVSTKEMCN